MAGVVYRGTAIRSARSDCLQAIFGLRAPIEENGRPNHRPMGERSPDDPRFPNGCFRDVPFLDKNGWAGSLSEWRSGWFPACPVQDGRIHGSGQRGSVASLEDSGRICYTFTMLRSDKDNTAGTLWTHRRIWPAWHMSLRVWFVVIVLNRPYEKSTDDFVRWCIAVFPLIVIGSVILYVIKSRRIRGLEISQSGLA